MSFIFSIFRYIFNYLDDVKAGRSGIKASQHSRLYVPYEKIYDYNPIYYSSYCRVNLFGMVAADSNGPKIHTPVIYVGQRTKDLPVSYHSLPYMFFGST